MLFKKLCNQFQAFFTGQGFIGLVVKKGLLTEEAAVQLQAGFLRFRVGSNEWVRHPKGDPCFDIRDQCLRHFNAAAIEKDPIVIDARESADPVLDIGRQPMVGGVTVSEQGVAAIGGRFDALRDGAQRRALHPGDIGVPAVFRARTELVMQNLKNVRVLAGPAEGKGI